MKFQFSARLSPAGIGKKRQFPIIGKNFRSKTISRCAKMRISIYDMDGTIVCSLHRYRTMPCGTRIDINHWRENEFRAYDDSLLPLAEQYKNDLADPNFYVIIATARVIREPDLRFNRDKLGMPNQIISRRDN